MATVYNPDTLIGRMWVDSAAPVTVGLAETTVFQVQKSTLPFTDTLTDDSIFKFYSVGEHVSTTYAHLQVTMQSGSTGSDWTTVKSFAREIGKDTLQVYNGRYPGIEGTFTIPMNAAHDYYRVQMNTYGTDSTTSFNIVAGLSHDKSFRDTPRGS